MHSRKKEHIACIKYRKKTAVVTRLNNVQPFQINFKECKLMNRMFFLSHILEPTEIYHFSKIICNQWTRVKQSHLATPNLFVKEMGQVQVICKRSSVCCVTRLSERRAIRRRDVSQTNSFKCPFHRYIVDTQKGLTTKASLYYEYLTYKYRRV